MVLLNELIKVELPPWKIFKIDKTIFFFILDAFTHRNDSCRSVVGQLHKGVIFIQKYIALCRNQTNRHWIIVWLHLMVLRDPAQKQVPLKLDLKNEVSEAILNMNK